MSQHETAKRAGFFDVRFTKFLSVSAVSAIWIVALIVISAATVIVALIGFYTMTTDFGAVIGLLVVVVAVVGGVLSTVLTRLFLEVVAILFRIGNHAAEIARNTTR